MSAVDRIGFGAWHALGTLAEPPLRLLLRRRARLGKEPHGRAAERRGRDAGPRPPGRLLWLHAASVGELRSVLPVLRGVAAAVRGEGNRGAPIHLLLTTATAAASRLAAEAIAVDALGAGSARHRMVPFDVPRWVGRFLDGWRPDAAVFVESELWPNLLGACRQRAIPLALLNARLSARSARRWALAPGAARALLGGFDAVWARSDEDARRLARFGVTPSRTGDLKAGAPALPCDPTRLAALRDALGAADRPRWCAASTHPDEERLIGRVHARLAERFPGLVTAVAPRHSERGAAIATALGGAPRRALGDPPPPSGGLWIADTMGELGLLFRAFPIVFLGRSLGGDGGGQNPWEPARLGCAVLTGPGTRNFREAVEILAKAGALRVVPDENALVDAVTALLADPAVVAGAGTAGAAAARGSEQLARDAAALLADLVVR